MSMRSATGTAPNLQQLGATRLQSALRAGQAVCATGIAMDDEDVERWLAEAEREVELDGEHRQQMRRYCEKVATRLRNCVKARIAKDKEIGELKQKLAACEMRQEQQANQSTQILRRKSVDDQNLRDQNQEIKELKKRLAGCAVRLEAGAFQLQGLIRNKKIDDRELQELRNSVSAVQNDLNKFLAERRRRSETK